MAPVVFAALVVLSIAIASMNWRHGWLMAILVGVLQDPARKLTPGAPVLVSMSVVVVYGVVLLRTFEQQRRELTDFSRRFNEVWSAFGIVLACLVLAAINGLMTFGIALWKAPLLSFFTYVAPLPAVMLGYIYLRREEMLFALFRFYTAVTSVALIGSILEYLRVDWRALGMVSQTGDYIRHLPGIQIRMISGFYRGPDIMGWHASTMTAIAIAMVLRGGIAARSWRWMVLAGWGFLNCMISGRRKAIYYVAVFAAVLLWRYFRRLKAQEIGGFIAVALVLALIVHNVSTNENSSVYARGAVTSTDEVAERLGGGLLFTLSENGVLGAGLGTATQGVYHVVSETTSFGEAPSAPLGWQEGGLGKLAIELGVPGLLAAALFLFVVLRTMLRISAHPDLPETSQLGRAVLFALVCANIANFMASAQAYADPLLASITAFFVGCLFATARLDELPEAKEIPLATQVAVARA